MTEPTCMNEVLQRIDMLMKEKNLNKYQLSLLSGISYTSIRNLFSRNSYPSIPNLKKICDCFQIHLSDFFRDPLRNDYQLSDEESHLVNGFRSLNDSSRQCLLAYMDGLRESSGNSDIRK